MQTTPPNQPNHQCRHARRSDLRERHEGRGSVMDRQQLQQDQGGIRPCAACDGPLPLTHANLLLGDDAWWLLCDECFKEA
jgi:hypothetical protein